MSIELLNVMVPRERPHRRIYLYLPFRMSSLLVEQGSRSYKRQQSIARHKTFVPLIAKVWFGPRALPHTV